MHVYIYNHINLNIFINIWEFLRYLKEILYEIFSNCFLFGSI